MLEEGSESAAAAETPQVRPGGPGRSRPVPVEGAGDPVFPQGPAGAGALLAELSERAELYRAALENTTREGGNGARLRRLQRGLKVSLSPWNWGFGAALARADPSALKTFGVTLGSCGFSQY